MANKVGRPTITLDKLPEGWEDKALKLYSQGGSDIEVRVDVLGGICHKTWTNLLEEDKLFNETIKKGRAASEGWWVKNGRTNLENRDFSYTGWYMNMKNRFKWADKVDANVNVNTNKESILDALLNEQD